MKFRAAVLALSPLAACSSMGSHEMSVQRVAATPEVYATVQLTADISELSAKQKEMIPLLIEASTHMDEVFWKQAVGERKAFLDGIEDPTLKRFAEINYGPWDRLDGNAPFIEGVGAKPEGANFYPHDISKDEFEAHLAANPQDTEAFKSLYTVIERNEQGELIAVPYSQAYPSETKAAAKLLMQAAKLAQDPGLRKYLALRSEALLSDEYKASDMAWMDMKSNGIDIVIGPIESYEDRLYGTKAAHEAYVLIKDKSWSDRLARYTKFLPELQRGLPVPDAYKQEMPGSDADLNAYDVVYYAGDCNSGSKTIAINLPNDEDVQLARGTRRLQLKNAMRAKYDEILVHIADELIDPSQRAHITFDAFFGNTMFHEVAHGLGVKKTLKDGGNVRQSLAEHASALEEGKADILGLYMVTQLFAKNEIPQGELMDNYVTFLAGIFRSVRFGASSAHGRANMVRFNFFQEMGAFEHNAETGTYAVNPEKMGAAVEALSRKILTIQGDGDYAAAGELLADMGVIGDELQADLDRLAAAGIPVDIVFEQGAEVLGL